MTSLNEEKRKQWHADDADFNADEEDQNNLFRLDPR
jgi:hypothetical protein